MALANDYNTLCPMFDFNNSGGVLFPYHIKLSDSTHLDRVNLDASADVDAKTPLGKAKFGWDVRLITCEAYACSDDQGLKGAACTVEAVLSLRYAATMATLDDGTEFAVITCVGTGDVGDRWAGTTTATTISSGQEIALFLKQGAEGDAASTNQDGAAKVVLWFAVVNAP